MVQKENNVPPPPLISSKDCGSDSRYFLALAEARSKVFGDLVFWKSDGIISPEFAFF
jgi:hypothetical protein